jgi:undecaprenyl-diphosphatase
VLVPLLAYLALGLVAGALAVLGLGLLRDTVGAHVTRFDEQVLLRAAGLRSPLLDRLMLELTTLGNGAVVLLVVTVAALFLYLTRHRYSALLLMVAVSGGVVLNQILKYWFQRPRPTIIEWETHATSLSFPSGHAMSSIIAFGAVALLVSRLEPTRLMRRLTWLGAAGLILGIGFSRVYLGVHYPSDVVAGYTVGLAWTAYVVSGIAVLRFFAGQQPEVHRAEKDLDAQL